MMSWFITYVTLFLLLLSIIYKDNNCWIKNFQLNLFFQLVFLLILVCIFQNENWNLGKCFINICIKKEHISFRLFMPTITSYFGFLLAVLTITSVLFISLNKIRLIWNELNRRIFLLDSWYSRLFSTLITNSFLGHWDSWVV